MAPERIASLVLAAGRPGHPVLIERELFAPLLGTLPQAKPATLLHEAGVELVECGDLANPTDVDTPAQLEEPDAAGPT